MENRDPRWPENSSYREYEYDEPYDRWSNYGAEHTQEPWFDVPRRQRRADRFRSDHDMRITRRRYDRDYENRDYDSRSYESKPGVMEEIKSFFGFGPKNYRRSDERIREDVCDVLTYDHDIDATHIDVKVEDSVVTLTGTVPQRSIKRLAEDLVENVRGVTDVRNDLRVKNSMLDDIDSTRNSDRLI